MTGHGAVLSTIIPRIGSLARPGRSAALGMAARLPPRGAGSSSISAVRRASEICCSNTSLASPPEFVPPRPAEIERFKNEFTLLRSHRRLRRRRRRCPFILRARPCPCPDADEHGGHGHGGHADGGRGGPWRPQ